MSCEPFRKVITCCLSQIGVNCYFKNMKKFRNFTPHSIVLNSGVTFTSEGIARVSNSFTTFDEDGICEVKYGEVEGLPEPEDDTLLIVSAMVLSASNRKDLVAPATGHPECVRNDKGQIVSVPGFVK